MRKSFFGAIAAAIGASLAGTASAQPADHTPTSQTPDGWEIRLDNEDADMGDVAFMAMPPGMHLMTGPALIAWHADSVASGDFRIESETFLFNPQGRREGYGFFVGGSDLDGPNRSYTYFLLRNGGEFLVKRRDGEEMSVIEGWTAHSAIVAWDEDAGNTAKNVMALEAEGSELRLFVNGEQVWSGQRGDLRTDGIFGLRVNHAVNVHITSITSGAGGG